MSGIPANDTIGTSQIELTHYEMQPDIAEGEEEADYGGHVHPPNIGLHEPANVYVIKRNYIHQLMDVALLMANVSQLKALLSIGPGDNYFYPLLLFIILSISLQVVFTLCMLVAWNAERDKQDKAEQKHNMNETDDKLPPGTVPHSKLADRLDKVGNVLVLLIIVLNVFITGFGVEPHNVPEVTAIQAPLPTLPAIRVNNSL